MHTPDTNTHTLCVHSFWDRKKTHYIHKISCIINKSNLIILNDKNGSLPVFDVVWCGVVSCIFVGLHAFAIHLVNPAGDGAVS